MLIDVVLQNLSAFGSSKNCMSRPTHGYTQDSYHVKRLLEHKSLLNTEIYINIEQALFQTEKR